MKKPTKAHIICHLLATHGPMGKEALLRLTAQVENKPYRPRSNGSYFQPHNDPNGHDRRVYQAHKQSVVAMGLVQVIGKQGNALVYNLTPLGLAKAAEYSDWADRQVA